MFSVLGTRLGIGIANVINSFDPDVVAIGGGVSEAGDLFLPIAIETARGYVLPGVGTGTQDPTRPRRPVGRRDGRSDPRDAGVAHIGRRAIGLVAVAAGRRAGGGALVLLGRSADSDHVPGEVLAAERVLDAVAVDLAGESSTNVYSGARRA